MRTDTQTGLGHILNRHVLVVGILVLLFAFVSAGHAQSANRVSSQSVDTFQCANCNGVLTATQFPGADIGAQVNAAFAACNNQCTVYIPAGSYRYGTTINMNKPTQSLTGAGSALTILNYTGSGDGVLWQMVPFTTQKAGTLQGISFLCTAATVNCIHSGSVQNSTWHDLTVSGAIGPNGVGILLENTLIRGFKTWTERTFMHNVSIGSEGPSGPSAGNTFGLVFRNNGGGQSFGYNDFSVTFNVEAGQTGTLIDSHAYLYHTLFAAQGNIDATDASTSWLTVKGAMAQGTYTAYAEAVNGDHSNTIHITSTGHVQAAGEVQIQANDLKGPTYGGMIPPTIDAGGFYYVSPWANWEFPSSRLGAKLRPMIQQGSAPITNNGTIVAAQGFDLQGRLILSWANNSNRMALMILDVACAGKEASSCTMSIPVNYAFMREAVFTNPTIKLSNGVPQVQVTIGDRNGVSQAVVASWYGVAGENPELFPNASAGEDAIPVIGMTSDVQGKLSGIDIKDSGRCVMTGGSCPAQPLSKTYNAAPLCFSNWDGTGSLTGILRVPSTRTTVTPSSTVGSDTARVNWACFGN